MNAILITTLLATAGSFALASLHHSWKRYGRSLFASQAALDACPGFREVRITVRSVSVVPGGARILRPDFKSREISQQPARALPAAA